MSAPSHPHFAYFSKHHRAIRRIRDKAFLHLLALHEEDKEAGEAAVSGFSDDIALCVDVIDRADNPDIRARAVYAPAPEAWDKDLLYRLAKEHPVPAVRAAAASRLRNDPAFMDQLAREDPDSQRPLQTARQCPVPEIRLLLSEHLPEQGHDL